MSVYRPPDYENLSTFFESITLSLSKASNKYENFLIMGDLNIDINSSGKGFNMLDQFCNLFCLSHLIKSPTCFTSNHNSTIDLIMTNKPKVFQKSRSTETGLSDCHNLVSTFFKSHYSKLKPKISYYRSYKNLTSNIF